MQHAIHPQTLKRLTYAQITIFLLCMLGAHWSFAEDRFSTERLLGDEEIPWEISANSLSYREKESVYVARGDVIIKKGDQSLYAKEAIYNKQTGIATVSGDVRFEVAGDVLTGEQGTFNLRTQTGKIQNGTLFLIENHFYVRGGTMEKLGPATYSIKDCRVTTCDSQNPAWSITGSKVKVTFEGYGKVKNAVFRVRGIPLLYLPYAIFPAKTERQTGVLPPSRAGYSSRKGPDIEVPFFWAISDQTDATFYQRLMGRRGYMQGLEYRYIADEGSKGIGLFDILSDKIGEKNLNDPDEVELSPFPRTNRTRYWLRGKADQNLPFDLIARMDADFVSDQDYLEEFEGGLHGLEERPNFPAESGRPFEERYSPTRRSALRLSRDQAEYSLQASGSYHQRPENPPEDETSQPLIGLDFRVLPNQLREFPVFFNLGSDYDYVWREFGEKGHRLALEPELRVPLWVLGERLELEPMIRYTYVAQWFDGDRTDEEHQDRRAYEASVRVLTNLERIYDLDWRNAKKLKHRIWPTLAYRYRVPQDPEDPKPWFEPIDSEGKVNQIILTLENFLDARLEDEKGDVTYRQWATLELEQAFDIDEARRDKDDGKKRPFAPLTVTTTVHPFPNIDLLGFTTWDHHDQQIKSVDLSLDLAVDRSGGRKDTFQIDYQYQTDVTEAINFSADVNLAYGFSAGSSLRRELRFNQSVYDSFWLDYHSQCWGAKFIVEKENADTGVLVRFRLLGF